MILYPCILFGQANGESDVNYNRIQDSINAKLDSIRISVDTFSNRISITDFGAIGDGVTDNTTAFDNAITYAASLGGGVIYVPDSTYKIDTQVDITDDNIFIVGSETGKSTILRGITSSGGIFVFTGANNCGLQYLYFDCDSVGTGGCVGFQKSSNCLVQYCTIINSISTPVFSYNVRGALYDHNQIYNPRYNPSSPGNHGFDIDAYVTDTVSANIIITNNIIDNQYFDACKMENIDGVIFANNIVWGKVGANDDDYRMGNVRNVLISNNIFHRNKATGGASGINIGSTLREGGCIASNNKLDGCGITITGTATDVFYDCDVSHSTGTNTITIDSIAIGRNSGDLVPWDYFDVKNIFRIGDLFTLNATGFTGYTFKISSFDSPISFTADILYKTPAQITAVTNSDITLTRLQQQKAIVINNDIRCGTFSAISSGAINAQSSNLTAIGNKVTSIKISGNNYMNAFYITGSNYAFLQGNYVDNIPDYGMYLKDNSNMEVLSNTFKRASYGIYNWSSTDMEIRDNIFDYISDYPMYVYAGSSVIAITGINFKGNKILRSGWNISNVQSGLLYFAKYDITHKFSNIDINSNAIDCDSLNVAAKGIYLEFVDNYEISSNHIYNDSLSYAINIRRVANYGRIDNNYIHDNSAGIYLASDASDSLVGNQIKNNYIFNNYVNGITVANTTKTVYNTWIDGNRIYNNGVTGTGYGIRIQSAGVYNSVITNNLIYDSQSTKTQDYGIGNAGNGTIIKDNILNNAGSTIVSETGTNTTTDGNIGYTP